MTQKVSCNKPMSRDVSKRELFMTFPNDNAEIEENLLRMWMRSLRSLRELRWRSRNCIFVTMPIYYYMELCQLFSRDVYVLGIKRPLQLVSIFIYLNCDLLYINIYKCVKMLSTEYSSETTPV